MSKKVISVNFSEKIVLESLYAKEGHLSHKYDQTMSEIH